MIELGDWDGAESQLAPIESATHGNGARAGTGVSPRWRAATPAEAHERFRRVYRALPGELAPKLALAIACELARTTSTPRRVGTTSSRAPIRRSRRASFGLARCRLATGDRAGALTAYDRVPDSSSAYVEAQTARIRCLGALDGGADPTTDDLIAAGSILEGLDVDGEQRAKLTAELLEAALRLPPTAQPLDRRARCSAAASRSATCASGSNVPTGRSLARRQPAASGLRSSIGPTGCGQGPGHERQTELLPGCGAPLAGATCSASSAARGSGGPTGDALSAPPGLPRVRGLP